MKNILITGANKGIGLACTAAILNHSTDTAVVMGCRSTARGAEAREALCLKNPQWEQRLTVLEMDVGSSNAIQAASQQLQALSGDNATPLYALVNNAGIGLASNDMAEVIAVNTLGVKRTCDAFLPLIQSGGRIVNVSSASGPRFVSQCSSARQAFFKNAIAEWPDVESLIEQVLSLGTDPKRFQALGLGDRNPYGFSKACTTLYTQILARNYPQLVINACTPGYIETDLTRPIAEQQGVAPRDMGMKPPKEGVRAVLHLLFADNLASGHYYGSDAKRSPVDRYRAPGDPEYSGD